MSAGSQQTIEETEARISGVLGSIREIDFGDFRCDRVILYMYDPATELLEPIFTRPERHYLSAESVPAKRTFGGTYMATLALESGQTEYSLHPNDDPRLSVDAKRLIHRYGIKGSLIACPLPPQVDASTRHVDLPVGVLLICADRFLPGDPEDQVRLTTAKHQLHLFLLLLLREEILNRDAADRYERLTQRLFRDLRPIGTRHATTRRLMDYVSGAFHTDDIWIEVQDSSRLATGGQPLLVSKLKDWKDTSFLTCFLPVGTPVVSNRSLSKDDFSARLERTTRLKDRAWMGIRVDDGESHVTCVVGRKAKSFREHFSVRDRDFLHHTVRVFQFLLKRSKDFDEMCRQLTLSAASEGGEPISQAQFEFVCQVFREFLNIDQVLLTKVSKSSNGYVIKGVYADGFERNARHSLHDSKQEANDWLVKQTERTLDGKDSHDAERLDVLPYLLREYMRHTSDNRLPTDFSPLFSASVDHEDAPYSIDPAVIETCGLKGTIYYLQCVSKDGEGRPTLRSIIHLGHSGGQLTSLEDAEPLLSNIGASIAESAASNERIDAEGHLRNIRRLVEPTPENLQKITEGVKEICHSIGCTLFLRSSLLHLVDWDHRTPARLEAACRRLLEVAEVQLKATKDGPLLRRMLRAFFGISASQLDKLLTAGQRWLLGAPLAKSLYIRVASSDFRSSGHLQSLLEYGVSDEVFFRNFVEFLQRDCYLPGHGLTGWVIRHGRDMLLSDKLRPSVRSWYQANRKHLRPHFPFLDALRTTRVKSRLSTKPIRPPLHADHIRDLEGHGVGEDAFVACCLEEIDDSHFIGGVLRASTSERLGTGFTRDHYEAMQAAARHVSWMVRRKYARQNQVIREMTLRDEMFQYHGHKASSIETALHTLDDASSDDGKRRAAVEQLRSVARQVRYYELHEKMIRELCAIRDEKVSPNLIRDNFLRVRDLNMLHGAIHVALISLPSPSTHHSFPSIWVLRLCFLIDEIITNSWKHSPCKPQMWQVLIADAWPLHIQIVECGASEVATFQTFYDVAHAKMSSYGQLLSGKKSGGGTLLYQATVSETQLDIQYTENNARRIYDICRRPGEQ